MTGMVIEGVVIGGRRLGRELGFPTANIAVGEELALSDGVYHTRIEVDGKWYEGMSNLGHSPSVGETPRRLESHLFDFSEELYGRTIRVELLEKIRDERRFATIDQLREQLAVDMKMIKTLK